MNFHSKTYLFYRYNANQESDDSEVDDEEINGNGEEVSVDGEDGRFLWWDILSYFPNTDCECF